MEFNRWDATEGIMEIQTIKTDISFSLEHNFSVTVELLRINDLWKIEVPHILENKELIYQLSSADSLVGKYADILNNVPSTRNTPNSTFLIDFFIKIHSNPY